MSNTQKELREAAYKMINETYAFSHTLPVDDAIKVRLSKDIAKLVEAEATRREQALKAEIAFWKSIVSEKCGYEYYKATDEAYEFERQALNKKESKNNE